LQTVRRDALETKVLDGLKHQLMRPEMVRTFVDEFHCELNRQAAEQDARRDSVTRDLAKMEREIGRLVEAIKAGVPGAAVKDEMKTLEARRSDLVDQLKGVPPAVPRLHRNVAALYREKIARLREALNAEGTRTEAAEMIRGLIEEIRLVPTPEEIIDKLEQRAGPKARKLFERFLRQINKLQEEQQLEAQAQKDNSDGG
jgi:site-specific DNA recombinase